MWGGVNTVLFGIKRVFPSLTGLSRPEDRKHGL